MQQVRNLQLAATAASPSVEKPSQDESTKTLKFLKLLAITFKLSSETTILFKLISSNHGYAVANAAIQG
jgi:hypothetical protein